MTVCITGAAGFIGYHLALECLNRGEEVIGIDNLSGLLYPAREKQARWDHLVKLGMKGVFHDLRTPLPDLGTDDISHVFHLAAIPGLSLSWEKSADYLSTNVGATQNLLEATRFLFPQARFIHVSTSSVYGKEAVGDENAPLRPSSPYGVSKLAAENMVSAYAGEFGVSSTILRFFSVYGPHQRPDMAYRKFLTAAIRGETITVFGDGEQSRTNTFVTDVVAATLAAGSSAGAAGEIINVAGNEELSLNQVISLIEEISGRKLSKHFQETGLGDQRRTSASTVKLHKLTGFSPSTSIREGMEAEYKWLRDLLS